MVDVRRQLRSLPLEAALVPVYVLLRVACFTNVPGPATDTPTYEAVARLPLWDWHFYAGQRGFTIPLFYKLVPGSEARIVLQLAVSIVAWTILAAVFARRIETRALRAVAFAAVLGTSLTWEVIRWDGLLLSESLTLSLMALLIASAITLADSPSAHRAAVFGVVALLWAFARDTNAYVLLVVAACVALSLVRPGSRLLKAGVAATCVAIFLAVYGSADVGRRWLQPLRDVVAHRVLPDPSMLAYFRERGFDPSGNWPESRWIVDPREASTRTGCSRTLGTHSSARSTATRTRFGRVHRTSRRWSTRTSRSTRLAPPTG